MLSGTMIKSNGRIATKPIFRLGLANCSEILLNLPPTRLTEHAVKNGEGELSETGALVVKTGKFTGRSPKDKYIVKDRLTTDTISWGEINQPFDSENFSALYDRMLRFLHEKKAYVRYARACASDDHRLNIAVVTTLAWHNLFSHHLFLRPSEEELENFIPEWSIFCIPEFEADPETDGTRQGNFTIIDFTRKLILIGGSEYAGEIKKAIFSVLNFTLPRKGILSMHCSANVGEKGDTALFFGLSGTGKTTLSADPERRLIGDDEHGWSGPEVFNFEGGCYAKVINLSPDGEPQIYKAIQSGSIVENTMFFPGTKKVNYQDNSVTENTRAAYPIYNIPGAFPKSIAGTPENIFFLTADAFGVLPPVSKLTPDQAMYHFLSGYTSKLAGTEVGVNEPVATFSACFGAAFLPLHPFSYAQLLGKLIKRYQVNVWLVNTGWIGGAYGTGSRISLEYTRSIIRAALSGALNKTSYKEHEIFGLHMPAACPGVPDSLLNPEQTWEDPQAYREQANKLANAFRKNYNRFKDFEGEESYAEKLNTVNTATL